MLKVQLRSKIGLLDSDWRRIEDILTGDFFGILDYLPRTPFLLDFFQLASELNPSVISPPLEGVDWESVTFRFWPKVQAEDEAAEPDLVIVSNKWVVIIEVKLDSGLGHNQPWREFSVGKDIATQSGLDGGCVYYFVVARSVLDIEGTLPAPDHPGKRELIPRASQIPWHHLGWLVLRWLHGESDAGGPPAHLARMLGDLAASLRRRRSLMFSGFAFKDIAENRTVGGTIFCPDRFAGFMMSPVEVEPLDGSAPMLLSTFGGFLNRAPHCDVVSVFLLGTRFRGFLESLVAVARANGTDRVRAGFSGFLARTTL